MTDPFEEAARPYEDELASSDELVTLARRRLSDRFRRASVPCSVCGTSYLPTRRRDGGTCSAACRQKKFRDQAAP